MTLTEKLFSESNTRFIVEIRAENKEKFEKTLKGFVFEQIGTVEKEQNLIIESKKSKISIKTKIIDLQKSWQRQLLG
jgi:phosphoribosylformylglycinamidine synthase